MTYFMEKAQYLQAQYLLVFFIWFAIQCAMLQANKKPFMLSY